MERLMKSPHRYYTQFMLQMAITGTKKKSLLVGLPMEEGLLIKYFDNEF